MNPYHVLGVPPQADATAIKTAYRQLAQESHPDRNPDDPSAEERFKEIGRAHAILSDPSRRRAYDEFGEIALDANFNAEQARAASHVGGFSDLGSLFEDLLGGAQRGPRARRGADLESHLELDFIDAALGCQRRIELPRHGRAAGEPASESLDIRIPAGIHNGAKIRLAGKGNPGVAGGPPGDLLARVRVREHRLFRRAGQDLHLEADVSITEAVLGSEFEVPTLEGKLTLRVPPGTDSGSKLRLRGKGIPASGGRPAGDLYIGIRIRVPKDLDEPLLQKLKELEPLGPPGLRDEFSLA
jgi:DnaJ-class molecular chaperone